jgi:hypothetical protein
MGSRQIVLVSTAGISVLNAGIFWRKLKQKGFFHSAGRIQTSDINVLLPHYFAEKRVDRAV